MNRRYWPAALAVLALVVFGSFIGYTLYLVGQIRTEARTHSQMYDVVQRGLANPEDDGPMDALWQLQSYLDSLGVPLVWYSPNGIPAGTKNLPFEVDTTTVEGRRRLAEYAAELDSRGWRVESPELGTIYYGAPPILRWLQWVPYLIAGAGILLVLVAVAIIRSNVRAERERMWAAMARELAHQMGTPLSALSGWVEVLHLPTEERNAFASEERIGGVIGADVERLERVSRRFELIGKPPALVQVELEKVVRELEEYFRPRLPRLGAGGIDLRVRARDDLPPVLANQVLLVWALENVVKNAVDALAGRGGRILISTACGARSESVHIRIVDNGPGIAPEVRDRIFEPGVTTKSAGWGVGLSLTQRIVHDLHGGRIIARGRRRGGTMFDIELPVAGKKLPRRRLQLGR